MNAVFESCESFNLYHRTTVLHLPTMTSAVEVRHSCPRASSLCISVYLREREKMSQSHTQRTVSQFIETQKRSSDSFVHLQSPRSKTGSDTKFRKTTHKLTGRPLFSTSTIQDDKKQQKHEQVVGTCPPLSP